MLTRKWKEGAGKSWNAVCAEEQLLWRNLCGGGVHLKADASLQLPSPSTTQGPTTLVNEMNFKDSDNCNYMFSSVKWENFDVSSFFKEFRQMFEQLELLKKPIFRKIMLLVQRIILCPNSTAQYKIDNQFLMPRQTWWLYQGDSTWWTSISKMSMHTWVHNTHHIMQPTPQNVHDTMHT